MADGYDCKNLSYAALYAINVCTKNTDNMESICQFLILFPQLTECYISNAFWMPLFIYLFLFSEKYSHKQLFLNSIIFQKANS